MRKTITKTKKGFETLAVVVGFVIIGLFVLVGNLLHAYYQEETVEITLKSKERVVDRGGDGARYLIWSEDGETFENVDSLIKGKFNSSDIYGQLDTGKTYKCKVYGWRNGFFSMYRNIVSCIEKKR